MHYLKRSFLFAITSVVALCSGLLISNKDLMLSDFWNMNDDAVKVIYSIIIIFLYSTSFFVSYTVRYPYPVLQSSPRKDSFVYIFIILCLITFIILTQVPFTGIQAFTIIMYGFIFIVYAIYSYKKYKNPHNMLVRNLILWPTTLTIGLCLYFGLSFKLLSETLWPIVPVLSLVVYFILSEVNKFLKRRKYFVISNIILIIIIAALPILPQSGITFVPQVLIDSFLRLLFCVVTSAYLAVFETWRITFHVYEFLNIKNEKEKLSITNKYYIATLMALSISILIYPYAFVFNIYGTVFLCVFLIHALSSLIYWFWVDTKSEIDNQRNWGRKKIWVGSLFLVILIIDSIVPAYLPKFETQSDLDSVKIIGLYLSAAALYPMGKLWQSAKKYRMRYINLSFFDFLLKLYSRRMNFVRSFAVLAVLLGLITLLIRTFTPGNRVLQNKTYYAIIVYAIMIILSIFFELVDEWPKKKKKMTPLIIGIGATTRIFSSVLIGAIVLLPLLTNSNPQGNFIVMSIALILAAMGGFALNDFFDSAKDKVDKSHRAIPSGVLTKRFTLILAISLISFSGFILIWTVNTVFQIIFAILVILGIIVYNLIVKYAAIIKSFFCAFLCCLPIIYIYNYSDFPLIWNILPLAIFFFISGRELLMDIHDIKGDIKAGTKTLPIVIGSKKTQLIAFSLLFMGAFLFTFVTMMSASILSMFLTTLIIVVIVLVYLYWDSAEQKTQRRLTLYLWLPLLLGIVSIASQL